jgi:hypothetical protein
MTTFSDLHTDNIDLLTVDPTVGNIWYVDSTSGTGGDAGGYGTAPATPFLTLDYAVGAATANNGDIIYLAPGHAETKAAAGSLWAIDQAGLTVVGLGKGADRATFTLSDTAAVCTISSASTHLENVLFVCGINAVVAPLTVSAADCTLKDVEMRDAAGVEFVVGVLTSAAADRLTVDGFKYTGDTVTGDACTIGISLVGTNNAVVKNSRFHGIFSTACIDLRTTKSLGVIVDNCSFENVGTALSKDVVEHIADCTFQVSNCFDMVGGYYFSGSAETALAADDTSAIATLVGTADATTTDSLHGKIGTDTEMVDRSLFDLLVGAGIPTAFSTAAAPAADKSIAAVLRDVWDVLRNGTGGAEPASTKSIMDYLGVSPGFFVPGLGYAVSKVEDTHAAGDDLFTVTGKILITGMFGEVTNALGAGVVADYVLSIKTSAEALCAATTITSDVIGTMYSLAGDVSATLNGGGTITTRVAELNAIGPVHMAVGLAGGTCVISSVHTDTGDVGDAITWTLFYLPLEAAAAVVAA